VLVKTLGARLRCVRFDKEISPSWCNDAKGWTRALQVEAIDAMGLPANDITEGKHTTLFRMAPATGAKLNIRAPLPGVALWCDQ